MSAVVLRCPTCGTTQGDPGECDACLAGVVRYFCGNHTPGLWLDEPACRACGARFGQAPTTIRVRPPGAAPAPVRKTRGSRSRSPLSSGGEPASPRRRSPPARVPPHEEPPATPSLAELLADIAEERERARYDSGEVPSAPTVPAPRVSIPVVGCLIRLVLLVLFFIALALGAVFILLSGGVP